MKNGFRHHLENCISFPLIYRFAGIRRALTELEADIKPENTAQTITLTVKRYFGESAVLLVAQV